MPSKVRPMVTLPGGRVGAVHRTRSGASHCAATVSSTSPPKRHAAAELCGKRVPMSVTTVPPSDEPLLGDAAETMTPSTYEMSSGALAHSAPLLLTASDARPGAGAGGAVHRRRLDDTTRTCGESAAPTRQRASGWKPAPRTSTTEPPRERAVQRRRAAHRRGVRGTRRRRRSSAARRSRGGDRRAPPRPRAARRR